MHWAVKYLDQQWSQRTDCWWFFRKVQMEQYGRIIPEIDVDSLHLPTVIRTIRDHEERTRWAEVRTPMDGDGVLLGRSARLSHVGIFVAVDGGKVLHCDQKAGTLLQDLPSLRLNGWNHVHWYSPCN
jgi:hypothetical protein